MSADFFTIRAITNLHVGSGDINFDIVDNQVQKDEITRVPIIHSSSIKGAFREHFKSENAKFTEYIFGGDDSNKTDDRAGAYSFFEASLLTRPVRSNKRAYYNATAPMCIAKLIDMMNVLDVKNESLLKDLKNFYEEIKNTNEVIVLDNLTDIILEDEKAKTSAIKIENIPFLNNIAIYPDDKFKELELPVVARNKIGKEGTSENLWYEEIVPKESQFFFFIIKPDNIADEDRKKADSFDNRFLDKGEVIQVGANKSIGYGFCEVRRIS